MIGHGCPRASRRCRLPATRWGRLPTWPSLTVAATWLCCAFRCHAHACRGHEASNHITCPGTCGHGTRPALDCLAPGSSLADGDGRRPAGANRLGRRRDRVWHGTISVSEGSLSEPQPLGVEADEPGSMWLAGDSDGAAKLVIQQRSPRLRRRGRVGLRAADGKLRVQLSAATIRPPNDDRDAAGRSGRRVRQQGTRQPRQPPAADAYAGRFAPRGHLPATVWCCARRDVQFRVEPHALPLPKGARRGSRFNCSAGGKELWSQQHDVQAEREEAIPLEMPLPGEEGVYDVAITAANNPNWSQAVRQPLNWKRTIAERRVQLLVLRPQRPPRRRPIGSSRRWWRSIRPIRDGSRNSTRGCRSCS